MLWEERVGRLTTTLTHLGPEPRVSEVQDNGVGISAQILTAASLDCGLSVAGNCQLGVT